MDLEVLKVAKPTKTKKTLLNGKVNKKRKRTSSGLIERSETMKGTETEFEEFVIDRTITPQRKLVVKDIEKTEEGPEKLSDWRKNLENTLLGCTQQPVTDKKRVVIRPRKTCFNCSGDHNLRDCPRPKNFNRISKNKKELAEKPRRFVQDSVGLSKRKTNNFKPGELSDTLRVALGLNPNDIPDHVYRMRRLGFINGYPPGWLRRAIKSTDTLKVFSFDEERNNTGAESMASPELDVSKIVCYPGFNGADDSLNDHESFKIPPAEIFHSVYQKQLTDVFKTQRKAARQKKTNQTTSNKFAKHTKFVSEIEDDDDVIVLDGKDTEKNDAEYKTPGEESVVMILDGCVGEENIALKTPVRKNVKTGESLFEIVGTPTFDRHNLTPVAPLEAFAIGIQPFTAGAEDVQSKGVFHKIMKKLKEARIQTPESFTESKVYQTSDSLMETFSPRLPTMEPLRCEAQSQLGKNKNKKRKRGKKN